MTEIPAGPIASLSLDLDNKWSYLKTHGDPTWESYPSYLETFVPRFLDFCRNRNLRVSVFVVGRDAALERCREPLQAVAAAGHEIANHSYSHEPWLHLYSDDDLEAEFDRAEKHIEDATGLRPRGFRGPGFSLSPAVLRVLAARGYVYDASTFPTFLGPLARAYYFMKSDLTPEERARRKNLFGSWADGIRPLRPYFWQVGASSIIEIPVTTMPLLRVPIHVSYVLYLSRWSPGLALWYYASALHMCRLRGIQPSILLHPLDFLGCDDVDGLSFFPGMNLAGEKKRQLVGLCVDLLTRRFRTVSVMEHARAAAASGHLPIVAQPRPGSAKGARKER